jgi:hypothetical protein
MEIHCQCTLLPCQVDGEVVRMLESSSYGLITVASLLALWSSTIMARLPSLPTENTLVTAV